MSLRRVFDSQIRFIAQSRGLTGELLEAVWSYARALRSNGQLAEDYSVSWRGSSLRLLCVIPERCSLALRFHDACGRKALREALKLAVGPPGTMLTGKAEGTPGYCSCRRRPSVHIFTHLYDDSTPLACGACHQPVPLYRLRGLSLDSREALLCWQWAYQACDDLWMHSGFGERWAYGQLSKTDSGLTEDGLELRVQVEKELKLPVYYYLHRYFGRSKAAERMRLCPGCGGEWLLPKPDGCFDFRCEPCRLLSCLAPD